MHELLYLNNNLNLITDNIEIKNKIIYLSLYKIKNKDKDDELPYVKYYFYKYNSDISHISNLLVFPFINIKEGTLDTSIYNYLLKYSIKGDIKGYLNFNNAFYIFIEITDKLNIYLKGFILDEICNINNTYENIFQDNINIFLNNSFLTKLYLNNNICENPKIGFIDKLKVIKINNNFFYKIKIFQREHIEQFNLLKKKIIFLNTFSFNINEDSKKIDTFIYTDNNDNKFYLLKKRKYIY
jgi:hypothetical protein